MLHGASALDGNWHDVSDILNIAYSCEDMDWIELAQDINGFL
jgi:hypothetical protein